VAREMRVATGRPSVRDLRVKGSLEVALRRMYHLEIHHLGRPHFHARYADDEASIDIDTLAAIAGELPTRAARLVPNGLETAKMSFSRTGNSVGAMSPCAASILSGRPLPFAS
jgi:Domain of unknown function (DUF4160)